jgi:hypothetical protein
VLITITLSSYLACQVLGKNPGRADREFGTSDRLAPRMPTASGIVGKECNKHKIKRAHAGRGPMGKERCSRWSSEAGKVCSRHAANVTAKTLRAALVMQVDRRSYLITDEAAQRTV